MRQEPPNVASGAKQTSKKTSVLQPHLSSIDSWMSDSPSPHPAGRRIRECVAFHHIPFTPVPVKPRHDGWTPERQRGFIDRLCVTGCVARAARAVGKSPQSAYRLREHAGAGSFRRAWDKAHESGQSYQIDVAIDRGLNGVVVPVVRNGRLVRERYRHDNRLAMAALNAMDRRAARRAGAAPDPIAVLERYLDFLERRGKQA